MAYRRGMDILMRAGFYLRKALALLCALLVPAVAAAADESVQLFDTAAGKNVSVEDAAKALSSYDVVMLGEFHDSLPIHHLETELFSELCRVNGEKQALSMEMFERDTQPVLDAYLAGEISEADFLARSRPWPNYQTGYRDTVEFAKSHHRPVIAANVPRPLAAVLAKTGTLDAIPSDQRRWLPLKTYAPDGPYKEKFWQAMKAVAAEGMPVHEERIPDMYRAQCLKDDAMAESIDRFLTAHPGKKVFHMQGEFHGIDRLGVAQKLHALRPDLKIAVLTAYRGTPTEEAKKGADFLLLVSK